MQLYIVTFKRRQCISVFDARGNKIEEKNELIEQTICDLPFTTASMYQGKTLDCVITRQVNSVDPVQRRRKDGVRFIEHERAASPRERKALPVKNAPTARPDVREAARTGDLSVAISRGA